MASAFGSLILKKRSSFLAAAASGKKWVAPGFILQFGSPREESLGARFGFTATKRIGNAVQRNRAKRRLRALAHEVMLGHAARDRDYVFVARGETLTHDYKAMKDDLVKALHRMKAWREAEG